MSTRCLDDSCDAKHCPRCGCHKVDFYVPGLCQQCSETPAYTARITFRDPNQPAINRECDCYENAAAALAELLRDFASVKGGYILEPDGNKACFAPDGGYLFTVPESINRKYPTHA